MANFEEFVQAELPTRPFVGSDGAAGQILVRSNNPLAVRELIWSNLPTGNTGSDAEASAATYSYDGVGNLTGITETVNGLTRSTVLTYNASDAVQTVAVTYDGATVTTTYSYNPDGSLASFVVT